MNLKKAKAIGGIGAMIGGGIGGYISVLSGNYLYGGVGAGIGAGIGWIIGLFLGKSDFMNSAVRLEKKIYRIDGVLSLLLSVAGIIAFIMSRELLPVFGAIFFGLCALYLLTRKHQQE